MNKKHFRGNARRLHTIVGKANSRKVRYYYRLFCNKKNISAKINNSSKPKQISNMIPSPLILYFTNLPRDW